MGREGRAPSAHWVKHVGTELAYPLARAAIERRIRIDKVAQLITRDLELDGELEEAEEVAAARPHGGGADEHTAVGVLDDLDEAFVARPMDPAAGGDRRLLDPGPHVDALGARLLLGQAGRTHFGIAERHPRLCPVIGARSGCAQDVLDHDVSVVDRHVREAPADSDIADRPEPLTHPEMVIRLEPTRGWIEADGLQPDIPEVGTASRRDQQLLTGHLATVLEPDRYGVAVLLDGLRPRIQVQLDAVAPQHLIEDRARLRLL